MFREKIVIASLSAIVTSCGTESSFTGSSQSRTASSRSSFDASVEQEATDERDSSSVEIELLTRSFRVSERSIRRSLDIVWIIDESGSMDSHNQKVETNLDGFNASVENFANVQTFSSKEAGWDVFSRNSLDCILWDLSVGSEGDCRRPNSFFARQKSSSDLKDFLRADSVKVVVFVTDDDSDINADSFLQQAPSELENTKYFGFVGKSSCADSEIENVGQVYEQLANLSGGEMFSLCDPDWTAKFSKLTDSIEKSITREFELNISNEARIEQVLVNNVLVDPSNYSYSGSKLSFTRGFLKEDDTVIVRYAENS